MSLEIKSSRRPAPSVEVPLITVLLFRSALVSRLSVLTETSPKEEYLSATISLKGFVILSPVPPSSKNFSINYKGLVSKSKIS